MKNITIKADGITIPAMLNDTVAAKDFETRLPFRVKGTDSGIDYCCVAAEGKCEESERQTGWKNGDINLAGGWFALLYGGEEQSAAYTDMMIIGHIDAKDLPFVRRLPKSVSFTVELAE